MWLMRDIDFCFWGEYRGDIAYVHSWGKKACLYVMVGIRCCGSFYVPSVGLKVATGEQRALDVSISVPVFADCTVTIVRRMGTRMLRFVQLPRKHGIWFNRTVVSSYS